MTNLYSRRNIPEAAVVALVQGKIEMLERRIERLNNKPSLTRIETNLLLASHAQISALQTVIGGLKWIVASEDVGTVRDHVGGEFPMAAGESLLSEGDR